MFPLSPKFSTATLNHRTRGHISGGPGPLIPMGNRYAHPLTPGVVPCGLPPGAVSPPPLGSPRTQGRGEMVAGQREQEETLV